MFRFRHQVLLGVLGIILWVSAEATKPDNDQAQPKASYLWRITSPHYGAPSYLFGTVHRNPTQILPHLPDNVLEALEVKYDIELLSSLGCLTYMLRSYDIFSTIAAE